MKYILMSDFFYLNWVSARSPSSQISLKNFHGSTFQQIRDISINRIFMIHMTSICETKISADVRLIHAEQMSI